ncbi:MAG: aspartate-semialdehyde dehydrogenase [Dehalococcoidia bacterium]|nr:aspartate-semialdehyde dehydrogenase [Dehalococcoidia bacterium]
MKAYDLAIVGATGMVGQEIIKILERHRYPLSSIHLFASDRSAGRQVFVNHRQLEVREPTASSFEGIDIALFCAGAEVSRYFTPIAIQSGAVVVDNSAAFRLEPGNPLVVPEVNADDINSHKGVVANPCAITIQLVMAINPLHLVNPIKRVIVSSYQAVSGMGSAAMEELTSQTKLVLAGQSAVPHFYPHQIAFNLLPEIDVFLDSDYTKEEMRIIEETRKVMHLPELAIAATCVQVPVFIGNSMTVNVEFSHPMSPDEAQEILTRAPGVEVRDDPTVSLYPHPWSAVGLDTVLVGRIRRDLSHSNGLIMWVVTDNLRKGSALNAIQIVGEMVKRGKL